MIDKALCRFSLSVEFSCVLCCNVSTLFPLNSILEFFLLANLLSFLILIFNFIREYSKNLSRNNLCNLEMLTEMLFSQVKEEEEEEAAQV